MLRKSLKLLVTTRAFNNINRVLSTAAEEELIVKPKKRVKKTKDETIPKDIFKSFDYPGRTIAFDYPATILKKQRKKSKVDALYIADQNTADKIFESITKNLPKDKLLVEVNPGIGLLTKRLIEKRNKLILFESDKILTQRLNDIVTSNPDKEIILNNTNFLALWRLEFIDKFDNGLRCEMVFKEFERAKYYEDTVARVFASVGNHSIFKNLVTSVIFQNSYLIPGRSEYFFCVPPSTFMQLTCSPAAGYFLYRPLSVLFQILFEYEFITRVNRRNFLPWQTFEKTPRKAQTYKFDEEYMYLMRVVPRKNLYEHCQPSQLAALWFFILQHLRSRSKQLIPTMEQWIPGCGPRLIINAKPTKKSQNLFPQKENNFLPEFYMPCQSLTINDYKENIHVFTQFGSLTPMQIFTVFNQFINWPEYESCAFNSMLDKHLEKMYSNPDENSNPLDADDEDEELESSEDFETKPIQ